MESGNLPIFIGRRTAAERLGCTLSKVERFIGGADIVIRVGVRDDPAWLLARLDHLIEFQDFPAGFLWTRNEARRRLALSVRVAMRVLNRPVAFLASAYGHAQLPLFAEKQLDEIRQQVASGTIKVQTRSLRGPKRGVCQTDPRHTLASDLGIEAIRIRSKRKDAEFWAKLL
jgi:hypothetical protein